VVEEIEKKELQSAPEYLLRMPVDKWPQKIFQWLPQERRNTTNLYNLGDNGMRQAITI